jgi:hypothetical protein
MRHEVIPAVVLALATAACARSAPQVAARPVADTIHVADTVVVQAPADSELRQRASLLQVQLLERDAQIADLRDRLEDAMREVVRTLARLQTVAGRAEAASAMAEAELAYQTLKARPGNAAEAAQARRLLDLSAAEFNRQNYGGAAYLATQVKGVAGRMGAGARATDRGQVRPGETAFSAPLPLQLSARSNLRAGPGTGFGVQETLDRGAAVLGVSYLNEWIRITDEQGRTGWVYSTLLERRAAGS